MLLLLACLSRAEILVDPPPSEGVQVTITVLDDLSRPVSGATVRAVERPELARERDIAVGLTDGRGVVRWKPASGGPYRISVREDSRVVQVAYASPRKESLVLLILLALVGLGATTIGLWPRRRAST